jgi:hypothetical protein
MNPRRGGEVVESVEDAAPSKRAIRNNHPDHGITRRAGNWGCSSVGRAPESHSGGRRFDPDQLHQPSLQTAETALGGPAPSQQFGATAGQASTPTTPSSRVPTVLGRGDFLLQLRHAIGDPLLRFAIAVVEGMSSEECGHLEAWKVLQRCTSPVSKPARNDATR